MQIDTERKQGWLYLYQNKFSAKDYNKKKSKSLYNDKGVNPIRECNICKYF